MIKCQVETPTTAKSQANRVTYRRYHKINMDTLRNDLSNCSFVACPGDTAKKLYDQYTNDLSNLLDKHAPEVTRCLAKEPAKWISDTYKNAKSIRRQFERIWRKKKTLNRAKLRKQFYCVNISYLVDQCICPARSRSRQTLDKNVLSWALTGTGSVLLICQVS